MRIVQILPVLAFGDAVGNDTRALKDARWRQAMRQRSTRR